MLVRGAEAYRGTHATPHFQPSTYPRSRLAAACTLVLRYGGQIMRNVYFLGISKLPSNDPVTDTARVDFMHSNMESRVDFLHSNEVCKDPRHPETGFVLGDTIVLFVSIFLAVHCKFQVRRNIEDIYLGTGQYFLALFSTVFELFSTDIHRRPALNSNVGQRGVDASSLQSAQTSSCGAFWLTAYGLNGVVSGNYDESGSAHSKWGYESSFV